LVQIFKIGDTVVFEFSKKIERRIFMANRKDKVTKEELRGLCRGRSDAIKILEKLPNTPENEDILAQRMTKVASDLANEIADKLDIFLAGHKA
jgi:hypothetical protein